jgi:hypothetical protein
VAVADPERGFPLAHFRLVVASVEKAAEFWVIPQGEAHGFVLFEGDWSLEQAAPAVKAPSGAPDAS